MDVRNPAAERLQLWCGIECSVTRIRDGYFDQMERSGHRGRVTDLDLLAGLGVRVVRYPVHWEKVAPHRPDDADWSWPDQRLARLRRLDINPIVGLVHHGSGPRHTSLVDPHFPDGLAGFAAAVARRYPWVDAYTPVNEPLTTARFSALYGHWYPHARDALTFARALLTQCRAVVQAMRAVRAVNPAARLVQTEDLGKTFSTQALKYQADFENERRWLTWDLLCGRVDRQHPMWGWLRWAGVAEAEVAWFLDNPCPPNVVGVNHYVTSARFLDERLKRYPAWTHGGNGRQAYADVEAVRVRADVEGVGPLLGEVWQRYRLPVAVTEAHLGCTREEQMRWFMEVWDAALARRAYGEDVRAVTAWSVLGAYDWDSLMVRRDGHYEPGAFDLRGPGPRPTGLAAILKELGTGRRPGHPVLDGPGWWRRPERLLYAAAGAPAATPQADARPLLIAGATGTLGRAFARVCTQRGLAHRLLARAEMDIADPASVRAAVALHRPWAVVNAAGYVRVDDAERDVASCRRVNSDGPAVLAGACAAAGVALLTFSSDLVFDGRQTRPYHERDAPAPLCEYGRSKAEAEGRVLETYPRALVVRTSAFFGPWDRFNFVVAALGALAVGRPFAAAADATISPTYVPDLVNASLDLLIDGESGIWHLANVGAVSWLELARRAARAAGVDSRHLRGVPSHALGLTAPRPPFSALGSERGLLLPSLDAALHRFCRECELPWFEAGVASAQVRTTPNPLVTTS